uniref:Predicted protein n=1 Tax=Hordeum vulgare subsp. vulgare TaxID=112509 RepID=F2D6M4_HORVV|nr:predicted protein [Hordeum vulgare subsp. vulgare]
MLKRMMFGTEAMDVLVGWTKNLCSSKDLPGCSVLDIGTGSGRLLQQLAKQGFSDLTGIDYSEAAIELVRNLAIRDGFEHINFLVDDVLESKLERRFELVMDEGTLDKRIDPKDPDAEDTPAEDDVESLLKKLGMDVETEYSSEVKDAKTWNRWSTMELSRENKQWMPLRENSGAGTVNDQLSMVAEFLDGKFSYFCPVKLWSSSCEQN